MTQTTDASGVPIFGAGADHTSTIDFAIEVYDSETDSTTNQYFKARGDLGAGPFVAFVRASQQGGDALQMGALNLLVRVAVDTDGLPTSYERALAEDTKAAQEAGDPAPEADPRLQDVDEWSSKRRFLHFNDNDRYHIAFAALPELAQWLVREALKVRPTQGTTGGSSSSGSSRSRTRTAPGSTARRSKKAGS